MAVREVLLYPDERLKTVCSAVETDDPTVDQLIQDLVDTMLNSGHSVGVAAPQIGDLRRVVVVDVSNNRLGKDHNHGLLTMINPKIIEQVGSKTMREGCMSVPDYTGNVERAKRIVVEFTDRNGHRLVVETKGFESVAIQHEIDHIDGLLFLDKISSLKTDLFRRKS